jgi:protein-arginine kinase activator protein McsA
LREIERLRELQGQAILDRDFQRAAQLRDQIAQLQRNRPGGSA